MNSGIQQSMFSFDGDEPGVAHAEMTGGTHPVDAPSSAWSTMAVEACFGGQKTRWKALAEDVRQEVLAAMWGYARARALVAAAPLRACDAEAALLGWLDHCPAASHARVLAAHLLSPSDVPAPA